MKIKYFAWIKEITQIDQEEINLNELDNLVNLDNLKKLLITKYPNLKKHFSKEIIRFAVNQEYVVENIKLDEEDEIAVFPPVSGG